MSRNLRHKSNKGLPLGRKTPKKSKYTEDTSDDDYSGVDLVSDSEDDDADVRAAEEAAIIESEYEDDDNVSAATPRSANHADEENFDDDNSSWGGFDMESEGHSTAGAPAASNFFADAVADAQVAKSTEWALSQDGGTPKPRRVHFEYSDSSSEDSDVPDDVYPDIFLEQDRLDPRFRKEIENDKSRDNMDNFSDDGSFWDFAGDHGVPISPEAVAKQESDDSSTEDDESSSDYDSEGDTTEEEIDIPPFRHIVNSQSVLRRSSTDSSSSEEEIQVTRRNPYARRGPQLGTWFADPSKPYAMVDTTSKKLVVVKGRAVRSSSFNGTPSRSITSFAPEFNMDDSPMISNSGNVMLSAMYNMGGMPGGGAAVGPPEAFYPFVSINADGAMSQDEPSSYDEDDNDDDNAWDLQDIFDFGEEGGDEDEDEDDTSDPNAMDMPSTPGRPLSSEDQVHPLLEHFGRTSVGAFRSNQNRHALITRNTASKDSLAFSGPFGGPIRGIKSDRMAAANSPITPIRRKKQPRNVEADPSSPAAAVDNKRKFSGEQHGHKRSRSMM